MASKGFTRENYPNMQQINWDASNLVAGKVLRKAYNRWYLGALRASLEKEFAYFRCEILICNKIMNLKINKESLVRHEDRI